VAGDRRGEISRDILPPIRYYHRMSLRDAYEACAEIPHFRREQFETIEHVDEQRRCFRPTQVRAVLLAESHCFTSNKEAEVEIDFPNHAGASPHQQFRRFVYCLGYGEQNLLSRGKLDRNSGTWQYWKIFCAAAQPRPWKFADVQVGGTPDLATRLSNKINLLNSLKAAGIWLVDASPLAIAGAGPKMGRPPPQAIESVLERSWKHFTRDVIRKANPETVIVIGRAVHNILGGELRNALPRNTTIDNVPQPQARGRSGWTAEHLSIIHQHCYRPA
jgi:hypothetical protein